MLSDVRRLLDYPLFTFNEETVTVIEVLAVPLWIIVSLIAAKLVISKVANVLKARNKDPNFIQLIERVLYVVVLVAIFFATLAVLKVPITAFAFLSGAIAIGFGFGAQNIINNFISGWILIGEKPIRIGDFLELEGVKGVVEEINTRSTRVRRVDGVHMLIPNSKLLENTVINWTLRDKLIRGTVSVGVQYGSNCDQVARIMLDVTNEQEEVLQSPKAQVFFQEFGDNALVFEVYFWINSQVEGGLRHVASNIRFALNREFNQDGIVVAFPQRDIHLDGAIEISRKK
ncbi:MULTISPECIES: mechanosensitive ion channel family protein [Thalassotalea]|uniref:mechanosensitive ion channel family protein n=1 Tax=Thalassotalea TaxID=1518149 RepID=UPI000945BEE8|nr:MULTISPECIES: mechanosensitive ion channel domain-containing protein [Thalassotalea]OKY27289.1 mechanosensitive ion channel protein [Thalassotalea sp. PP2-459]